MRLSIISVLLLLASPLLAQSTTPASSLKPQLVRSSDGYCLMKLRAAKDKTITFDTPVIIEKILADDPDTTINLGSATRQVGSWEPTNMKPQKKGFTSHLKLTGTGATVYYWTKTRIGP